MKLLFYRWYEWKSALSPCSRSFSFPPSSYFLEKSHGYIVLWLQELKISLSHHHRGELWAILLKVISILHLIEISNRENIIIFHASNYQLYFSHGVGQKLCLCGKSVVCNMDFSPIFFKTWEILAFRINIINENSENSTYLKLSW